MAFTATMTVETAIKSGPDRRGQHNARVIQNSRRQWDRDHVVAGGPEQVLDHFPVRGAGQFHDSGRIARVGPHQDDVRRFDGDVRTGPNGDADVRLREGRGIVHAIARHGHYESTSLHLPDLGGFLVRQNLGEVIIQVQLAGDPASHRLGIPRDHHRLNAQFFQPLQRLARFRADDVRECNRAFDLVIGQHIDHRLALLSGWLHGGFARLERPCSFK